MVERTFGVQEALGSIPKTEKKKKKDSSGIKNIKGAKNGDCSPVREEYKDRESAHRSTPGEAASSAFTRQLFLLPSSWQRTEVALIRWTRPGTLSGPALLLASIFSHLFDYSRRRL